MVIHPHLSRCLVRTKRRRGLLSQRIPVSKGLKSGFPDRNRRQRSEHFLHRNHSLSKSSRLCHRLQLLQSKGILYPKFSRPCTHKLCHHGAATEALSDIMAEGSDIGSPGTRHLYGIAGMLFFKKFQGINGYRTRRPLHFLSRPCKVAELLSTHLQGGIHRRKL